MGSNDRHGTARPLPARLREALSVLDAVADCIVIVDATATVLDIKHGKECVLDLADRTLIGQPLDRCMPGVAMLLPPEKILPLSVAHGGVDGAVRGRGGDQIPVHIAVSRSQFSSGQFVLAIRDLRAVQSAENRLLETERLVAIGETTTALAHESRNALQRMHACLILLRPRCDAPVQELIDDMEDALDQLQHLYEEFRTFAAPLQLKLRKVDLKKLLDRTWRQLKVQWGPKQLSFAVQRSLDVDANVKADAARLGQVFMNVIENAIQASPDRGNIVALLDDAESTKACVSISIQDQGPGMSPEVRAKAFDLLYTTKPGGTGMGLVIARRIVREHHGRIALVDSQLGARVQIVLPRQQSMEAT